LGGGRDPLALRQLQTSGEVPDSSGGSQEAAGGIESQEGGGGGGSTEEGERDAAAAVVQIHTYDVCAAAGQGQVFYRAVQVLSSNVGSGRATLALRQLPPTLTVPHNA